MNQFRKSVYFEVTHHMFRMVFLSIIRSLRLYIQLQVYVKQILLLHASVPAGGKATMQ